jgi:hypothetical protein
VPDEAEEGGLLIRFLTGSLPEEERRAVESRIFSEAGFFDRLCAAEEELIRDFLRDELPSDVHSLFQTQLGRSPDLRRRLGLSKSLMAVLARASSPETRSSPPSFWASLRGLLTSHRGALWCAVAAGALAVTGVLWLGIDDTRVRARLDGARTGPSSLSGAPAVLSFVLAPGATRGEGSHPRRLFIPRGIGVVRLRLPVSTRAGYSNYRVLLSSVDGGFEVWSADVGPALRAGPAVAVNADVPAGSLERGDYLVRLQGLSPGGGSEDIETYSFGVLRP